MTSDSNTLIDQILCGGSGAVDFCGIAISDTTDRYTIICSFKFWCPNISLAFISYEARVKNPQQHVIFRNFLCDKGYNNDNNMSVQLSYTYYSNNLSQDYNEAYPIIDKRRKFVDV